jgi:hypothetical protein
MLAIGYEDGRNPRAGEDVEIKRKITTSVKNRIPVAHR